MIAFISWIVFGLIIGLIAKAIHRGEEPVGFLPTIVIGIAGSFLGGMVNHILSGSLYRPAGFVMSIIGGVLFCAIWKYLIIKKIV